MHSHSHDQYTPVCLPTVLPGVRPPTKQGGVSQGYLVEGLGAGVGSGASETSDPK